MTSAKIIKEAMRRFAIGRALTVQKAPYAADTIYGLAPQFFEHQYLMGVTTGMVIYVDPKRLVEDPAFENFRPNQEGVERVAGCIFHEVSHVQRDLGRLEALPDHELAGIAGDEAINFSLREAGWLLPPWVIYPELYGHPGGKTIEWYYRALEKQGKKTVLRIVGDSTDVGRGRCGSAVSKTPDVLEQKLDLTYGRLPVDVDRIRYQTAEKAQEANRSRAGFGSLPGFLAEGYEFNRKAPVVPWPRILSLTCRRVSGALISGGDDLSYARPNKRAMGVGLLRPGPVTNQCTPLLIRDSSGSMGEAELNEVTNQALDIMKHLGIDSIWLIDADVVLHGKPRLVSIKELPKLEAKGRGGTDFVVVLAEVVRLKLKPDFIIYATDGDGPAPRTKPRGLCDVIWCVVKAPYMRRPALWGHFVVCSNEQRDLDRVMPPYGMDEPEEDSP